MSPHTPVRPLIPVFAALAAFSSPSVAQHSDAPQIEAVARSSAVELDGRLDEAVWSQALPATGFSQRGPREAEPATQRTEVRFLFDEDAIYVGARMYDRDGEAGVTRQLVRRDAQLASDFLNIVFDTYHDHLGSSRFTVNPSGVKRDALGASGGGADPSWDPVWEAAAHVDSAGWTAELRIPFNQLRFPEAVEQTWGLQIERVTHRLNEVSWWSFWGLDENGGPTRYGHLMGLRIPKRPGRMEISPYLVGQSTHLGETNTENLSSSRPCRATGPGSI